MKILVPVKRVVDYNVKVRVKPDNTGVDLNNVKMSINPFDEIAVEEAVRLKEKGVAKEVVALTIGPAKSDDILRTAMAIGAERGVHIETEAEIQPLAAAKLIKKIVEKETPDMVILGKQAIDDDANQTGQLLAALLGWPQATFASKVTVNGKELEVTREIDAGLVTIKLNLPAVVTVDLRLNTPRFAKLPDIMKARSKKVDKFKPEDLGVDITARLKTLKVEAPEKRKGGGKVKSVDELVTKLKEAGVL